MNIRLVKMNNEKMHEFFREFTYDPVTTTKIDHPVYVYDEQSVNAYFEKHKSQGKLHYAIMLQDKVIGDVYLKNIDHSLNSCEIGIHLISDTYKGKGYGTHAIRKMLKIAFDELNMKVVKAETLIKNERSRRALEKAGLVEICRDNTQCYYEYKKCDP